MKTLTTLTLLLVAQSIVAQYLDVPTKKSTTVIVVLDNVEKVEAYLITANLLQDNGFVIADSDQDIGTLSTEWKETGGVFKYDLRMMVSVRQRGKEVLIHLRAQTRQDGATIHSSLGIAKSDNNYYTDVTPKANVGKDWKQMEALAAMLGTVHKYL